MYVLQNLYKLLLLNLLKFIIHLQNLESIYEKHLLQIANKKGVLYAY